MRIPLGSLLLGLGSLLAPAAAFADGPSNLPPPYYEAGPATGADSGWSQGVPVPAPPSADRSWGGTVVGPPPALGPSWGERHRGYRDRASEPGFVAWQLRGELDEVSRELHADVARRSVMPMALGALERGRDEVERDLARAAAKGFITPDDRAHLEAHVQELRCLADRFHVEERAWGRGNGWGHDDHRGWGHDDHRRG